MKETLTKTQFIDRFLEIRPNDFSAKGLSALYDFIESYEEDTGAEIEFDPIAICCDWSEYSSLEEIQADYGEEYSLKRLEEETLVIPVGENGFIVQSF